MSAVEKILLGIVIFFVLIVSVGAFLGTVFDSVNSTAQAAWHIPTEAQGLYSNLGLIIAVVIIIVLIIAVFSLTKLGKKKAGY